MPSPFPTLQTFEPSAGRTGYFHSLPALEAAGIGPISRLPHSIRIVLESVLRNCDGKKVADALKGGQAWDSVLGPISFDKKGDITTADYVFYVWKNGNYSEL